jgi:uncharacterized membrane protein
MCFLFLIAILPFAAAAQQAAASFPLLSGIVAFLMIHLPDRIISKIRHVQQYHPNVDDQHKESNVCNAYHLIRNYYIACISVSKRSAIADKLRVRRRRAGSRRRGQDS